MEGIRLQKKVAIKGLKQVAKKMPKNLTQNMVSKMSTKNSQAKNGLMKVAKNIAGRRK